MKTRRPPAFIEVATIQERIENTEDSGMRPCITVSDAPRFIDSATIVERASDTGALGARLEDDPGDVLAGARLELIYREEGNWPGLIELLLDRAEDASDDEHIECLREVATIYERELRDPDGSLVVLLAAFERDAAADGIANALDNLAYQTGQWDEVIDAYMMAAGKISADAPEVASDLWLRIACAHLVTTGDMGAVTEALGRVTTLEADGARPYLDMVEQHMHTLAGIDTMVELCRRIGDDGRRSRALSRAVAMATNVADKARYHLAIADVAEGAGDAETARWHYTEALRLDPTRAGAREALVAMYRRDGDHREVAEILAGSRFSANQTERAAVALEAASIYADELDENTRAVNLYAFVLSQDPEHVGAALPLAERYYNEKRWQELAPVLDLLISRYDELGPMAPEKAELHFQAGECAVEMKDHHRARDCFEAALEAEPGFREANRALAAACTEIGDHDAACNAYNAVLVAQRRDKVAPGTLASTLVEMARTRTSVGDDDAALTLYESALDLAYHREAFDELRAIYAGRKQWRAIVHAARCQIDSAPGSAQVELYMVIAEISGRHLEDPHSAIEAYERAHHIEPDNRGVIHQLIEYYGAAEMWEQSVHSMLKVAELESDKVREGKYLQAAGTVARHHLDAERAVEYYNLALDCFFADGVELPERLRNGCMKAFTDLGRCLYSAGEFKQLEKNYRQMIRRMRAGSPELPELWHGLGQVYRKHLRKTEEAIESFEVASALDADRDTHDRILIDLYRNAGSAMTSVDQIDKSISRRQKLIAAEPFVSEHYRELRHLYLRSNRVDEAWTAARALVFLGVADPEEADDYHLQKPSAGIWTSGQLGPKDWEALRHADENPRITQILALVSEAAALETASTQRKLGLRDDPTPLFDHLRRMFVSATGALGLPAYDVFIQPEISGDVLLANVRRGRRLTPIFAAGRSLYEGQSVESIIYTLTRALTYGRPGYLLRLALSSAADIESVFLAAASLSRADVPVSPALMPNVARYQASLHRRLRPEWKRALAAAVDAFVIDGAPYCIDTWGHAVDATGRRAGLLLSGDLEAAVRGMSREPSFAGGRSKDEKVADLIVHSVGSEHQRLRAKLGLAIPGNDIARYRRDHSVSRSF